MTSYTELEKKAELYTKAFIAEHPNKDLNYHNLDHTSHVVEMVTTIGNYYKLDEQKISLLRISAWFHDIGYFAGVEKNHEDVGTEKASIFLKENSATEEDMALVSGCIMATKMPQNPKGLEQEIICDADLSHLASPFFFDCTKKLRKEIEKTKGTKISKEAWLTDTLAFISQQHYFTSYGKEKLEPEKQKNIQILQQNINEENQKAKEESKEEKKDKPSKGIETMFRITSSNNQKLSSMADNKAHILISVNSIILSAIISLLLRKLTDYEYLSIPTYIILTVSVLSMIFSLVATRPNLPSGEFTKKDIDDKKVNLLFFGNFYKMSLEDYTKGMEAVMEDYSYLYQSLIKDVYSQGVVLSHKYKLLRISYTIFMFGMILSVISFIIASALHS
ncbi:MAG: phosphohydrolase [Pseudopedobacter saltans]|uniref:Phosphohydrolase n=1 Tax=Pseudopedobacter saltans TaxID=151895 RepID=A0A2W5EK87_9SPHI|nr:MAG: phosphohydrolase [Pseudopedobacter saltans]